MALYATSPSSGTPCIERHFTWDLYFKNPLTQLKNSWTDPLDNLQGWSYIFIKKHHDLYKNPLPSLFLNWKVYVKKTVILFPFFSIQHCTAKPSFRDWTLIWDSENDFFSLQFRGIRKDKIMSGQFFSYVFPNDYFSQT